MGGGTLTASGGSGFAPEAGGAAWMLDPGQLPGRFIGPVECVLIEGKGRGVRATRGIAPGELLLLSPPLAALVGAPGDAPTPAQLVDAILAGAPGAEAAAGSPWLGLLYDGAAKSARTPVDFSRAAAGGGGGGGGSGGVGGGGGGEQGAGSGAGGGGAGARAGGAGAAPAAPPRGPAKRERQALKRRVAKAVAFNAFADRHQDLALAALARGPGARGAAGGGAAAAAGDGERAAGEAPAAVAGLWPEFAMLNHCCAPNAINYPLHLAGGRPPMVVRAARAIAAGEEVTISYFGAEQLTPLAARRAALRAAFGFDCGCTRCAGEAASWDSVGATVEAVAEATAEMRPAFERALAARDAAALLEARLEAGAVLLQLYGEFRANLVRPTVRTWHQAGLHSTLEMAADADAVLATLAAGEAGDSGSGDGGTGAPVAAQEAGGGGGVALAAAEEAEAASLGTCLSAVETVSPGSDLHVQLAARAAALARRRLARLARSVRGGGGGAVEAAEAAAAAAAARCERAHVLRYGDGVVAAEGPRLLALSEELSLQGLAGGDNSSVDGSSG
ncbi:MAG: hypothetical protein J3K34DRAFT_485005 [Monoraphidium minutum]|nr:MAG: hypothetical protein J3K34DRAFT_485005 [Monoraphidium minutum]